MTMSLPPSWERVLGDELRAPYFRDLQSFLTSERRDKQIFPAAAEVFAAFAHTPFDNVKVVLLGQDPYHGEGQAHGLSFSVKPPTPPPPSLKNIYKELTADLGVVAAGHGDLTAWAERGILLLNTVLTVEAHRAHSHKKRGWEQFTDAVIRHIDARPRPVVFLLWGAHAQKKKKLIDTTRHRVVEGAHPSPLSAKRFFGSRPFSAVNRALVELGHTPIDWTLPSQGAPS